MLASRQGEKRRMLLICDKTHLRFYSKKSKNRERSWSEEDAVLVRTWYGEGVMRFFTFLLTLHIESANKK